MLDLASFYDTLLPGQFDGNSSRLRALKPGTHTWGGIKFDARGMVDLQNQPNGKVTGIPVGQKCSWIAFVHGFGRGLNQNNTLSRFVIHYANGHAETIPLVFGKDVASSYLSHDPDELNAALTNSVVWAEIISRNGAPPAQIVFYVKKWTNPFPEETVTAVDFAQSAQNMNPFLVAITVRPVND